MDRALLEQLLGEGLSLAEIGRRVGRHESTVSHWMRRHGLEPSGRAHRARGALDRDELGELVQRGLSSAEIAVEVGRSKTTVRHWLKEYGLATRWTSRREAISGAPARVVLDCRHHGAVEFCRRSGGGYRCTKCRAEAVTRRRRRVKELLVEEAGGRCVQCGYDRCVAALEFHHVDPAAKQFALSHRGVARSYAKARAEAAKCVLLCANCHAEVEAGFVALV